MIYYKSVINFLYSYKLCIIYEVPIYIKNRKILLVCFARGVVGFIDSIFWYEGVRSLPMGEAITIINICPVVCVFLSALILDEKVRNRDYYCVLLGFAGVVMTAKPSFIVGFFGYTQDEVKL